MDHEKAIENTKAKINGFVTQNRRQQKAGDFIRLNNNSIRLYGKNVKTLMACSDRKRLHEIIPVEDEFLADRFIGDSVTISDVFTSSENAVWDGNSIRFRTEDGMLLSSNQYEYILKHGPLPQYSCFGKSNNKDLDLKQIWKLLSRKASDARKDKSKDILYLTIGTVTWNMTEATEAKPAVRATSPLILCQITEAPNSKDGPRYYIVADIVRANSILARELKQKNVDLFANVSMESIAFGQHVIDALKTIEANAQNCSGVEVDIDDMNICILDSTNESLCQLIEKRNDGIATSPLVQVLMGERAYKELVFKQVSPYEIYPLPADDSQREAIRCVLDGHSLNISAAAGTGKTHLMVQLSANLIVCGKKLCVMSEKKAANEVFLKYADRIGMKKFCLVIDNKMTVPQIVDQVDRIRRTVQTYVNPVKARDLLSETDNVEKTINDYYDAVYSSIPELDMSLYELTGEALVRPECPDLSALRSSIGQFRTACRKLEALQADINSTITGEDFGRYLETGTTGDEEADELINESVDALKRCGVDVISFVKSNGIGYNEIAPVTKANMARILAKRLIVERNIEKVGNMFLRAKYSKLTECYAKMESLYVGYLDQRISEMIVKAVSEDNEFLPLLDRIKTSKMTVQTLFKKYGEIILKLCPIIVTTPSAAVNYITEEMNKFDTLLIDEASQVPILGVLPFLVGDRQLIAFGDNMQLDITSFFKTEEEDGYDENGDFDLFRSDRSILHLVQGKGIPTVTLFYHYRSKTQHIFTVSNMLCYNERLNITPDVYTGWDKLPPYLGYEMVKVDVPFDKVQALAAQKKTANGKKERNFYLDTHIGQVKAEMSARIADKIVEIKQAYPDKSIGVVTLNEEFKGIVQDEVEDAISAGLLSCDLNDDETLWIRSLENAQGKEADVVIIAIDHARRSVSGVLQKNISGFFHGGEKGEQSGKNRLNVLFTRAREKNVIFLAFDYNEIKDSERSLQRLYTYLEYAATGNMSCVPEKQRVDDKLNAHAAEVIADAMPDMQVRTKIGSNMMMVDLGMLENAHTERYAAGFLLPDRKISTNALYTKINLLERAGWKVLPLSLVYLLDKPSTFKVQLPKMLNNGTSLGNNTQENFLVTERPAAPVTLEELSLRGRTDKSDTTNNEGEDKIVSQLTPAGFAKLDIEQTCRMICEEEIATAPQDMIDASYKQNTQAFLIKLAQGAHKAAVNADKVKLSLFANKAYYLYKNMGEKRACYLLAQLLRLRCDFDSESNQRFIVNLIEEALAMGILKEVV